MICSMRLILLAPIFAGSAAMIREQSWADDEDYPTMKVVLFLIVDLGWMVLGCQGGKYYQTPNIDQIVSEGGPSETNYLPQTKEPIALTKTNAP